MNKLCTITPSCTKSVRLGVWIADGNKMFKKISIKSKMINMPRRQRSGTFGNIMLAGLAGAALAVAVGAAVALANCGREPTQTYPIPTAQEPGIHRSYKAPFPLDVDVTNIQYIGSARSGYQLVA